MDIAEIYAVAIDLPCSEDLLSAALACAAPERQKKAAAYRFADDRKLCILADALARRLASEKTGISPKEIQFGYGPYDKPYFANVPEWQFSVSHSGRWLLAGIAREMIGVDVETLGEATAALARYALHPEEYRAYETRGVGDRDVFYRFWTLKESYIKYLGLGLTMPLNAFWFTLASPPALHLNPARFPADLRLSRDIFERRPRFFTPVLDDGHAAAICTDAAAATDIRRIDPADLCRSVAGLD